MNELKDLVMSIIIMGTIMGWAILLDEICKERKILNMKGGDK